jgi:hypothetical protein
VFVHGQIDDGHPAPAEEAKHRVAHRSAC